MPAVVVLRTMPKLEVRLRHRWVIFPLYVGTALLVYNQRVGGQDGTDVNWLQAALRTELWFAIAVFLGLIVIPKWTLWPRVRFGTARTVLLTAPLTALSVSLFATALTFLRYNVGFDLFGARDAFGFPLGIGLGILVFNLAVASNRFAARIVALLTWMPLASVILGVWMLLAPASLGNVFGEWALERGVGMFGHGERFQGLTTNPNMLAISSSIALAFFLPRILQATSTRLAVRISLALVMLGLLAVMAWTGVRAMLVVMAVLCSVALWLRFRPTGQGLRNVCLAAVTLGMLAILALLVLWQSGLGDVLTERLDSEDGRLFLWRHYTNVLLENPLGLGFAFETVVETDNIILGQRLPPHNTLLLMAMFGGWAGLIVHLIVLGKVWWIVAQMRRSAQPALLSILQQGLVLGLCADVVSLMFSGLMFYDFYFIILTALLLAEVARPVMQPSQIAVEVALNKNANVLFGRL